MNQDIQSFLGLWRSPTYHLYFCILYCNTNMIWHCNLIPWQWQRITEYYDHPSMVTVSAPLSRASDPLPMSPPIMITEDSPRHQPEMNVSGQMEVASLDYTFYFLYNLFLSHFYVLLEVNILSRFIKDLSTIRSFVSMIESSTGPAVPLSMLESSTGLVVPLSYFKPYRGLHFGSKKKNWISRSIPEN